MPRDVVYYIETPRYRIEILPASPDPMPADPDLVQIPDGAIAIEKPSDAGYKDDLPIGDRETASYTATVSLHQLGISGDLRDLREYLTDFRLDSAGEWSFGGTFDLFNLWRIYTKRGGTWVLAFEGCQRLNPEPEYEIIIGKGAIATFELFAADRVALELVKMPGACDYAKTMSASSDWTTVRNTAIDSVWTYDSQRSIWMTGDLYSFKCLPWRIIIKAFERAVDETWSRLLRLTGDWSTGQYHFVFKTRDSDDTHNGASPYDYYTFAEQDPDSDGLAGDDLSADDVGVMVELWYQSRPDPVGGLLNPGQDSLQSWATLYDFVHDLTESTICRTAGVKIDPDVYFLWFFPATEAEGPYSLRALTPADFRGSRGRGRRIKMVGAANVISGTDYSARGGLGKDKKTWKRDLAGSEADKRFTIKGILNNLPAIGEYEWWDRALLQFLSFPTEPQPYARLANRVWVWNLYYLTNLWGESSKRLVRVHDRVRFPNYVNSFKWGPVANLSVHVEDINGVRARLAIKQDQSTIARAAEEELKTFASKLNSLAEFQLPINLSTTETITSDHVGRAFALPLDGDGLRTAMGLVDPATEWATADGDNWLFLRTKGVLVRANVDHTTKKVKCKLFGLSL